MKKIPLVATSAFLLAASSLSAANLSWDPTQIPAAPAGGAGSWNNTSAFWSNGADIVWSNTTNAGDTAVFGGAGGTVTLANAINLGGLTFSVAGYTVTGQTLAFGTTQGAIDSSALGTGSSLATIASALTGTAGLTIKANGNLSAGGGNSSGSLTLSGANTGLTGGVNITGGLVFFTSASAAGSASTTAGSGNLITLSNAGGIVNQNSADLALGNNIAVTSTGGTVRQWGGRTLTLNGAITGTGVLTKTDTGTVILAGDNSGYSGTFAVGGGTLQIDSLARLGTSSALTLSGGTLAYAGTGTETVASTATWTLTAASGISVATGATLDHQGVVKSGTLTKTGAGTLILGGSADNASLVGVVNAGTLVLAKTAGNALGSSGLTLTGGTVKIGANRNQIYGGSGVTINGGTFDINGFNQQIGASVNGTGGVITKSSATTAIAYINSGTWAGSLQNGVGILTFEQSGSGTLTLTGASTHTGGTTVNGTLVTGNLSALGAGNVTVKSGATLAVGNGTVNTVTLGSGATLAISGTLKLASVASVVTLGSGGTYTFNGTLNLNNLFDGVTGTQTYTLIAAAGGGGAAGADTAVAFTGYNSSLVNVAFSHGVLTVTAVPEPSAYGLLGAGALAAVTILRRRRRQTVAK